jgi:hypothetical protein
MRVTVATLGLLVGIVVGLLWGASDDELGACPTATGTTMPAGLAQGGCP